MRWLAPSHTQNAPLYTVVAGTQTWWVRRRSRGFGSLELEGLCLILCSCCSFCLAVICLSFYRLLEASWHLKEEGWFLGTFATEHLGGCPASPTEDPVSLGLLGARTPWCFCVWCVHCSPPLPLRSWEFKFGCTGCVLILCFVGLFTVGCFRVLGRVQTSPLCLERFHCTGEWGPTLEVSSTSHGLHKWHVGSFRTGAIALMCLVLKFSGNPLKSS